MSRLDIHRIETPEEMQQVLRIRERVFVEGQDIPRELEMDGMDAAAEHFLAVCEGRPVGTARLRYPAGDEKGKIERVAVLPEWRGYGVGRRVMEHVERCIAARGVERAVLTAQIRVREFYEKIGYRAFGEPFLDADIPHIWMEKTLRPSCEQAADTEDREG